MILWLAILHRRCRLILDLYFCVVKGCNQSCDKFELETSDMMSCSPKCCKVHTFICASSSGFRQSEATRSEASVNPQTHSLRPMGKAAIHDLDAAWVVSPDR